MPIKMRGLQPGAQDHLDLRAKLPLDLPRPRPREQRRDVAREREQASAIE